MIKVYCARWVLPISSQPISQGALAVSDQIILAVGTSQDLLDQFEGAAVEDFGEAAIIPGLVNTHSHLELTAMRSYLEAEEADFFAWLKKLTLARLERMSADDLYISALWGVSEAARAGITCVGDASDAAMQSMKAIRDAGLRGIIYQESFGPDPNFAHENFAKLREKVAELRTIESSLVRAGASPHAPYTVSAKQLRLIADFSLAERVPLMMHVAESAFEESLIRKGRGPFAENYKKRGIEWTAPGCSIVQYLSDLGILQTKALLTHCIRVDDADIELIAGSGAGIAHCPKSNAKLGHGRAPFAAFLEAGIPIGLGSDSVASNNLCDILEEARFSILSARGSDGSAAPMLTAEQGLRAATSGGATALGLAKYVGTLEAGLQADFAVVKMDGIHQQPIYDPCASLVFSSSGRDVGLTVVAGREIYREGEMLTVDEQRISARMSEIATKLQT